MLLVDTATLWNLWLAAGALSEAFVGGKGGTVGCSSQWCWEEPIPALAQMSELRMGFGEDFWRCLNVGSSWWVWTRGI